jgi:hypothetical protein
MISFRIPLFAALSLLVVQICGAQDTMRKAPDLPIFQALTGKRVETGVLIPNAGGQPLPGSATSAGQPALDGLWFQIDGSADYGPAKWTYRWMFLFEENATGNKVTGIYIDTIGQRMTYTGTYNEEENRIQLVANIQEGRIARFQLTVQDDKTVRIESVIFNADESAAVTYSAQNTAAE